MKILKALIEVQHPDANSTQYMGYPQVWLDNKERIPAILYHSTREDEIQQDGKLYQTAFLVVPDDLAVELLKEENITEAARPEVDSFAAKHYPIKTMINDQDAVLAITAKAALGETLTKEEKDALDPNSPVKGIIKTKPWVEAIEEQYGTVELK